MFLAAVIQSSPCRKQLIALMLYQTNKKNRLTRNYRPPWYRLDVAWKPKMTITLFCMSTFVLILRIRKLRKCLYFFVCLSNIHNRSKMQKGIFALSSNHNASNNMHQYKYVPTRIERERFLWNKRLLVLCCVQSTCWRL